MSERVTGTVKWFNGEERGSQEMSDLLERRATRPA
jgi:hypothetical protein